MHSSPEAGDGRGPSLRSVEIVVALLIFILGAAVVWDSVRIGNGWATEGPQAGFFPFYIGLIICVASIVNLAYAALATPAVAAGLFVSVKQFRQVLWVLVPAAIFVALIGVLGIYVAAALFIGAFMRVVGRFAWLRTVAVSLAVPIIAFAMFEIWFLTPLLKGPLEAALGY